MKPEESFDEQDLDYLFKILLLGNEMTNKLVWDFIKPSALGEGDIIPGMKFGSIITKINQYLIKLFFISFNPHNLAHQIRKAYVHGTNGVIIPIEITNLESFLDEKNNTSIIYLKELVTDIYQINKQYLPNVTIFALINETVNTEDRKKFQEKFENFFDKTGTKLELHLIHNNELTLEKITIIITNLVTKILLKIESGLDS